LLASGSVENMLSPKKAAPSARPYTPPTNAPSRRTSTLWAWPRWCSSSKTRMISALIQVSGWPCRGRAQPRMTWPKSWSQVTWNRPPRSIRRSRRGTWKPVSGRMPRICGATQ
jgi:hypothetical protein